MKKIAISIALLMALTVGVPSIAAQSAPDKALMQQILDAWGTLDPGKSQVYYSKNPDNVYFDIAPLKYNGWSEYEKGVKELFAGFNSLKMTVNDDAKVHHKGNQAWGTATFHMEAALKDGAKQSADGRWTAVWEKQGGKWLIIHEHVSLPAPEPAAPAAGSAESKQ